MITSVPTRNFCPASSVMIDKYMWIFKIKRQQHVGIETLSEYIDGRLSDAENGKVQEHLETCSSCAQELATQCTVSLSYTVQLLHRVPMTASRRAVNLEERPIMVPVGWQNRVPVWAYLQSLNPPYTWSCCIRCHRSVCGGAVRRPWWIADQRDFDPGLAYSSGGNRRRCTSTSKSTIIPQPAPGIEVPSVAETELQAPLEDAVEAVKEVDTESALLDSTDLIPAEAVVLEPSDLEAVPEIKPLLPEEFPAAELPAKELPVDRTPAETAVDDGFAALLEPADTEPGVDDTITSLSPASKDGLETFEPRDDGRRGTSVAWRVLEGILAGIAILLVGWALWWARKARSRVLR